MKKSMQVQHGSVERAGITKDYKEAIKQYIWNALEANATEVNIDFRRQVEHESLPPLATFSITDNGDGINYQEIESTFGSFLDSSKKNRLTKGGRGKGRLSFLCFAAKAVWYTTYRSKVDGQAYFYTITITSDERKNYEIDEEPKSVEGETGTKVEFLQLQGEFDYDDLMSEEFEQYLALEFGWYLTIVQARSVAIRLNGVPLDYQKYIQDHQNFTLDIENPDEPGKAEHFTVDYIEWNDRIGTESHVYMLDEDGSYVAHRPTGFNKVGGRAFGFVHSLYVTSPYFSNFEMIDPKAKKVTLNLGSSNKVDHNDATYKELMRQIRNYLEERKHQFLQSGADEVIARFERNKTLPQFATGPLGEHEREDFETVVKGVYRAAPTMLTGLRPEHERSMLGFINLTLKTDEREHILDIVGEVVELSAEDRKQLATLLKASKLSGVIKLLTVLKSRYVVVELLRILIQKQTKTTTERGQLQNAIQENCWLFGEEYNLIAADQSFRDLEQAYLDHINAMKIDEDEKSLRRPDVFIARSKSVSTGITGGVQQKVNLIIELKRPSVVIDDEQYRQVEDYRNILRDNPNYKSGMRVWHLYVIGVDLSDNIRRKRDSMKVHNRPFLVNNEDEFYIYAMTWAEVFDSFDARHDYLLADLGIDRNQVLAEAGIQTTTLTSQQTADLIVAKGKGLAGMASSAS